MNYSSRIKVFAPNIVRITHYLHSEGVPANRPWFEDVILPLSEQEKHGNPVKAEINNFLVQMVDQDGKCFFSEKKTASLNLRKSRPYLYFDIPQTAVNAGMHKVDHGIRLNINVHQDESFYGWGEWFNGFERKIGNFCLDNRNALFGEQDRLTYSGIPFFLSSEGYGFLLLNSFRSQWNLTNEEMIITADGQAADYIVIYGPSYKEILRSYTALTGRPPLLPRWAFGLWVTSYPQEDQQSIIEFADKHREKNIPLDAVILDYHWEEHFHNFQWRKKLIPDPEKLIAQLRQRGIRLGLILTSFLNTHNRPLQKFLLNTFGQNVTPGLEKDDERALPEFEEAHRKGFLAHEKVHWWFGTGGMLDFTNPGAVLWWQEKLAPLFSLGVEFIKNDDGEDLPDDAISHNGMDGREYHNNYGFYYGKATFEIPDINLPVASEIQHSTSRKVIYARSGWVGSQRYPALFMGDQEANFEGIQRGIRAGLNLGLSGFSYWTADVFGLSGKTTPEIHMRYAQWALLSPVARYFVRPASIDNTRFPWSHSPQVETNFRKYSELRLRLLPYYNTLSHECFHSGIPILRPMMVEFQEDERFRNVDNQIMFGSHLMICPITEANATQRKIILPEGTWFDFWSDQTWTGPDEIEYQAALDCLPLLVKGSTILPMGPIIQSIPDGHQFNQLEFHIWAPFPAQGIFVDDDGISTAYQEGEYSTTNIYAEKIDESFIITISALDGNFIGQSEYRQLKIILHMSNSEIVESVQINQTNVPFRIPTSTTLTVSFEQNIKQEIIVEINFRKVEVA